MIIIMAGMLKFEAIQYIQQKVYDPKFEEVHGQPDTWNLRPETCNLLYQPFINSFADGLTLGTNMQFVVNVFDMCTNGVETNE